MTTTASTNRKPAVRCLFGNPNSKNLDLKLKNELKALYEKDREKWNFDFEIGFPIDNEDGDYQFQPVSSNSIPSFYHEKISKPRKISYSKAKSCEPIKSKNLKLIPSTSSNDVYQKPVTRSATRLIDREKEEKCKEEKELKQTKLTNFMPVRKRRSETSLISLGRSASFDILNKNIGEKRIFSNNFEKKMLINSPTKHPIYSNVSSISDTTLVSSPRSPPIKRSNRRRRQTGAGDF